jgi:hypothetical protein
MKATLEIFWPDKVSRTDNLDDRYALSCARLSALCEGHAIVTLSDGFRVEYISDETAPVGYRAYGPGEIVGYGYKTNDQKGVIG